MTLDTPLSFQYNLFLKLPFKKENIKNSINLSFYLARISAPVLLIVMSVPIKVLVNRKTSKIPHTIKNCFQRKRVLLQIEKSFIYLGKYFPFAWFWFYLKSDYLYFTNFIIEKKMMKKLANTIYLESESTKPRVNLEIWKNGGFHDWTSNSGNKKKSRRSMVKQIHTTFFSISVTYFKLFFSVTIPKCQLCKTFKPEMHRIGKTDKEHKC